MPRWRSRYLASCVFVGVGGACILMMRHAARCKLMSRVVVPCALYYFVPLHRKVLGAGPLRVYSELTVCSGPSGADG
jgi:hypothetical protein